VLLKKEGGAVIIKEKGPLLILLRGIGERGGGVSLFYLRDLLQELFPPLRGACRGKVATISKELRVGGLL